MEEICPKCGGENPNCELCGEQEFEYDYDDDETKLPNDFENIDLDFSDLEDEENQMVNEQVNKSLDMFKRLQKYN